MASVTSRCKVPDLKDSAPKARPMLFQDAFLWYFTRNYNAMTGSVLYKLWNEYIWPMALGHKLEAKRDGEVLIERSRGILQEEYRHIFHIWPSHETDRPENVKAKTLVIIALLDEACKEHLEPSALLTDYGLEPVKIGWAVDAVVRKRAAGTRLKIPEHDAWARVTPDVESGTMFPKASCVILYSRGSVGGFA